jgi:hypothetical protein
MRAALSQAAIMLAMAIVLALPATDVLAQSSLGGVDPVAPSQPPQVTPAPAPAPRPVPRTDYTPPADPAPAPPRDSSDNVMWAAIGFTADGSYQSAWRFDTKSEAEAVVAKKCASYGRGACEVSAVSGRECVALATYLGRRWRLSFTAKGSTFPEAQTNAVNYCNSDSRTGGRCQFRTAVCADGR